MTVIVLLGLGVLVVLICCAGLIAMPDVNSRMHYLGPVTSLGAFLIAAGLLTEQGLSPSGVKSILTVVLLAVSSPVATHAIAQAARTRDSGHRGVRKGEKIPRAEE